MCSGVTVDRTRDLTIFSRTLSQLSYNPDGNSQFQAKHIAESRPHKPTSWQWPSPGIGQQVDRPASLADIAGTCGEGEQLP